MVEEPEISAFFLYSRNKTRHSINYFDINQVVWFPLSSTAGVEYKPTA